MGGWAGHPQPSLRTAPAPLPDVDGGSSGVSAGRDGGCTEEAGELGGGRIPGGVESAGEAGRARCESEARVAEDGRGLGGRRLRDPPKESPRLLAHHSNRAAWLQTAAALWLNWPETPLTDVLRVPAVVNAGVPGGHAAVDVAEAALVAGLTAHAPS